MLAVAIDVDRSPWRWWASAARCIDRAGVRHHPGEHDVEPGRGDAWRRWPRTLLALPRGGRCLGIGVSVPGAVRSSRRRGAVRAQPRLADEPFTALLADGSACRSTPATTPTSAPSPSTSAARPSASTTSRSSTAGRASVAASWSAGVTMRGADGYAGEVGHIQVDSNGERCRCGAIGCWETKVGENHLLSLAGRLPGGGAGAVDEVIAAAEAGDRRSAAGGRTRSRSGSASGCGPWSTSSTPR